MVSVIIIVQAVSTAFFFIPAGVDAGRPALDFLCNSNLRLTFLEEVFFLSADLIANSFQVFPANSVCQVM